MEKLLLLNLGCGPNVRKTKWIDCDGSWNARINQLPTFIRLMIRSLYRLGASKVETFPGHVKYVNLHNVLPFEEASVDAVYASHVWEHLYYDEALFASQECHRILKKSGIIRLVVPSLGEYVDQYRKESGSTNAAANLQGSLCIEVKVEKKERSSSCTQRSQTFIRTNLCTTNLH